MYICRKMRLCTFLLEKGFKYKKEVPDRYNPNYKCWLFDNTPELRNEIENYYSQIKKKSTYVDERSNFS